MWTTELRSVSVRLVPNGTPKIVQLAKTCDACPAQWEGKLEDGRFVYIRYRHGYLTAGAGPTPDDALYGTFAEGVRRDGEMLYAGEHGDDLDGSMSEVEMLRLTGLVRA